MRKHHRGIDQPVSDRCFRSNHDPPPGSAVDYQGHGALIRLDTNLVDLKRRSNGPNCGFSLLAADILAAQSRADNQAELGLRMTMSNRRSGKGGAGRKNPILKDTAKRSPVFFHPVAGSPRRQSDLPTAKRFSCGLEAPENAELDSKRFIQTRRDRGVMRVGRVPVRRA